MTKALWCQKSVDQVVALVASDLENGLSHAEVKKRQAQYPNKLIAAPPKSPLLMFLSQFTDTMVLVLLGATVISGLVGAMVDAVTIMAIVVINAILGFIQEYRAEKSLEEIKKLASSSAQVIREGKRIKIPSEELVPGDIVLLEAGDKVPADIRLIESFALEADEASLTGESVPVEKDAYRQLSENTLLAEQSNMVFMGTTITRGRGKGIAVATGMNTVMGEITDMLKDAGGDMTPLQKRLDQLGKILIVVCLTVCALVAILGIYRGEDTLTMLLAGISLAVAAIPEGLPAIVTVVLALGVQRMARKNAIVRKLPAVETLGCTTVVCSDKTGTLTQNQMTVKKVASLTDTLNVSGEGYNPSGKFWRGSQEINPLHYEELSLIIEIAANCNNSAVEKIGRNYEVQGDPTEGALQVMAAKAGSITPLRRIREIPFDSERKRMSVVVEKNGQYYVYMKGALEVVLESCSHISKNNRREKLDKEHRQTVLQLQEDWASEALRVLGFAWKQLTLEQAKNYSEEQLESGLNLVGMCGMIDPPRAGVRDSVQQCIQAGIIPIMITGDHPVTARVIARELGISSFEEVITGNDIDKLKDNELYQRAVKLRVFARVTPQHKNRIVTVLKDHGQVVAMTGDGVNDAPAVKAADIGIAMGVTGTEVTREASAMVLADDNFSTIISAVYEGRAIYDNIRKFVRYLLGCNIGEVLVMFLASLLGMPLPLLPIQILWINLVTDGLPAMALGLEPPEPGIMKRKPRARDEGIFAHRLGLVVFSRGLYISIITIATFTIGLVYGRLQGTEGLALARTMAFTTLVFAQLFYVFDCRSERYSPFELGFFKNTFLIGAVSCSIVMQLMVIYVPVLQNIFKTVPLQGWEWIIILTASGIKFIWKAFLYTWQRLFAYRKDYVKINV
ncbi:MAG: calcium-translocating P-type ATPase, SERCA-type [Syntrophomonadaceae bacterium]|jgi:Ca2+-transporting ATPase